MKKFIFTCAVFMLVTLFLVSGCKKEKVCDTCTQTNKPPVAMAGPDQVITLPQNAAILNGQGSVDPDGSIRHWRWNQLAGPANAILQKPDSARTEANNLTAGMFGFKTKGYFKADAGASAAPKVEF